MIQQKVSVLKVTMKRLTPFWVFVLTLTVVASFPFGEEVSGGHKGVVIEREELLKPTHSFKKSQNNHHDRIQHTTIDVEETNPSSYTHVSSHHKVKPKRKYHEKIDVWEDFDDRPVRKYDKVYDHSVPISNRRRPNHERILHEEIYETVEPNLRHNRHEHFLPKIQHHWHSDDNSVHLTIPKSEDIYERYTPHSRHARHNYEGFTAPLPRHKYEHIVPRSHIVLEDYVDSIPTFHHTQLNEHVPNRVVRNYEQSIPIPVHKLYNNDLLHNSNNFGTTAWLERSLPRENIYRNFVINDRPAVHTTLVNEQQNYHVEQLLRDLLHKPTSDSVATVIETRNPAYSVYSSNSQLRPTSGFVENIKTVGPTLEQLLEIKDRRHNFRASNSEARVIREQTNPVTVHESHHALPTSTISIIIPPSTAGSSNYVVTPSEPPISTKSVASTAALVAAIDANAAAAAADAAALDAAVTGLTHSPSISTPFVGSRINSPMSSDAVAISAAASDAAAAAAVTADAAAAVMAAATALASTIPPPNVPSVQVSDTIFREDTQSRKSASSSNTIALSEIAAAINAAAAALTSAAERPVFSSETSLILNPNRPTEYAAPKEELALITVPSFPSTQSQSVRSLSEASTIADMVASAVAATIETSIPSAFSTFLDPSSKKTEVTTIPTSTYNSHSPLASLVEAAAITDVSTAASEPKYPFTIHNNFSTPVIEECDCVNSIADSVAKAVIAALTNTSPPFHQATVKSKTVHENPTLLTFPSATVNNVATVAASNAAVANAAAADAIAAAQAAQKVSSLPQVISTIIEKPTTIASDDAVIVNTIARAVAAQLTPLLLPARRTISDTSELCSRPITVNNAATDAALANSAISDAIAAAAADQIASTLQLKPTNFETSLSLTPSSVASSISDATTIDAIVATLVAHLTSLLSQSNPTEIDNPTKIAFPSPSINNVAVIAVDDIGNMAATNAISAATAAQMASIVPQTKNTVIETPKLVISPPITELETRSIPRNTLELLYPNLYMSPGLISASLIPTKNTLTLADTGTTLPSLCSTSTISNNADIAALIATSGSDIAATDALVATHLPLSEIPHSGLLSTKRVTFSPEKLSAKSKKVKTAASAVDAITSEVFAANNLALSDLSQHKTRLSPTQLQYSSLTLPSTSDIIESASLGAATISDPRAFEALKTTIEADRGLTNHHQWPYATFYLDSNSYDRQRFLLPESNSIERAALVKTSNAEATKVDALAGTTKVKLEMFDPLRNPTLLTSQPLLSNLGIYASRDNPIEAAALRTSFVEDGIAKKAIADRNLAMPNDRQHFTSLPSRSLITTPSRLTRAESENLLMVSAADIAAAEAVAATNIALKDKNQYPKIFTAQSYINPGILGLKSNDAETFIAVVNDAAKVEALEAQGLASLDLNKNPNQYKVSGTAEAEALAAVTAAEAVTTKALTAMTEIERGLANQRQRSHHDFYTRPKSYNRNRHLSHKSDNTEKSLIAATADALVASAEDKLVLHDQTQDSTLLASGLFSNPKARLYPFTASNTEANIIAEAVAADRATAKEKSNRNQNYKLRSVPSTYSNNIAADLLGVSAADMNIEEALIAINAASTNQRQYASLFPSESLHSDRGLVLPKLSFDEAAALAAAFATDADPIETDTSKNLKYSDPKRSFKSKLFKSKDFKVQLPSISKSEKASSLATIIEEDANEIKAAIEAKLSKQRPRQFSTLFTHPKQAIKYRPLLPDNIETVALIASNDADDATAAAITSKSLGPLPSSYAEATAKAAAKAAALAADAAEIDLAFDQRRHSTLSPTLHSYSNNPKAAAKAAGLAADAAEIRFIKNLASSDQNQNPILCSTLNSDSLAILPLKTTNAEEGERISSVNEATADAVQARRLPLSGQRRYSTPISTVPTYSASKLSSSILGKPDAGITSFPIDIETLAAILGSDVAAALAANLALFDQSEIEVALAAALNADADVSKLSTDLTPPLSRKFSPKLRSPKPFHVGGLPNNRFHSATPIAESETLGAMLEPDVAAALVANLTLSDQSEEKAALTALAAAIAVDTTTGEPNINLTPSLSRKLTTGLTSPKSFRQNDGELATSRFHSSSSNAKPETLSATLGTDAGVALVANLELTEEEQEAALTSLAAAIAADGTTGSAASSSFRPSPRLYSKPLVDNKSYSTNPDLAKIYATTAEDNTAVLDIAAILGDVTTTDEVPVSTAEVSIGANTAFEVLPSAQSANTHADSIAEVAVEPISSSNIDLSTVSGASTPLEITVKADALAATDTGTVLAEIDFDKGAVTAMSDAISHPTNGPVVPLVNYQGKVYRDKDEIVIRVQD